MIPSAAIAFPVIPAHKRQEIGQYSILPPPLPFLFLTIVYVKYSRFSPRPLHWQASKSSLASNTLPQELQFSMSIGTLKFASDFHHRSGTLCPCQRRHPHPCIDRSLGNQLGVPNMILYHRQNQCQDYEERMAARRGSSHTPLPPVSKPSSSGLRLPILV